MFTSKIQKTLFTLLVCALGFIALQIPFTKLLGANVKFTMFDFYAPIVGIFLGSPIGLAAVVVTQLVNWAFHGFALDAGTIIRFFPILAATLYFSKKSLWQVILPVVCMIAFLAHPEGRAAWMFSLYWLIPIAMYFAHEKAVLAKALGATFTAHAVGGALWIWTFNMKAAIWMSLIPIVWKERGLMALGITLTYYTFKAILNWSTKRGYLPLAALTKATNVKQ